MSLFASAGGMGMLACVGLTSGVQVRVMGCSLLCGSWSTRGYLSGGVGWPVLGYGKVIVRPWWVRRVDDGGWAAGYPGTGMSDISSGVGALGWVLAGKLHGSRGL